METSRLTLSTSDGDMPTYEAVPDGEPRGGVLVVQEAFGVTDHIEDVCRRFAAAGWRAVAPALFHRTGSPVIPYDDIQSVMPHMKAIDGEGVLTDVDAALAHLASAGLPAQRCGAVGFCMGGSIAFYTAAERVLGAAVTFYGGGVAHARFTGIPALVDLASELEAPWLGLYGDQDPSIPVEDVEHLRTCLREAKVAWELVRYPDAGHGFHCDARRSYHEVSAKDGWSRTLEWFAGHIG